MITTTPSGKSLLEGNMILALLVMFSAPGAAGVAVGPTGSRVAERGMVVKIVEGPALLKRVLGTLPCQHHLNCGYVTHDSKMVVGGDRSVLPPEIVGLPAIDSPNVEGTTNPLPPTASETTASGAISPIIPSRNGKVPDLATDVEAGSSRDIEVGTEIVEKIPASLSLSAVSSKCSPARLILLKSVNRERVS